MEPLGGVRLTAILLRVAGVGAEPGLCFVMPPTGAHFANLRAAATQLAAGSKTEGTKTLGINSSAEHGREEDFEVQGGRFSRKSSQAVLAFDMESEIGPVRASMLLSAWREPCPAP